MTERSATSFAFSCLKQGLYHINQIFGFVCGIYGKKSDVFLRQKANEIHRLVTNHWQNSYYQWLLLKQKELALAEIDGDVFISAAEIDFSEAFDKPTYINNTPKGCELRFDNGVYLVYTKYNDRYIYVLGRTSMTKFAWKKQKRIKKFLKTKGAIFL